MKSLKGYYLLAVPELLDSNFRHAVLLLVQHDANGALGLILNQPIKTNIAEAWEQISSLPCNATGPLHIGGPCEGPMIVLHRQSEFGQLEVLPAANPDSDGVYFTTDADQITHLISQGQPPLKCFVGYAGWTAGQLEEELENAGWIVGPASVEGIFETRPDAWPRLLRQFSDALRYPDVTPATLPTDPSAN